MNTVKGEKPVLFDKGPVLLDGAMGTELQRMGMAPGTIPEILNLTRPEWIREIHTGYLMAGSRVIYANTFGANALKLRKTGYTAAEVVRAGVTIARDCARTFGAQAALDVGPLGTLLEPLGTLSFEEAYRLFAEVMEAGAEAGADLIVIETMSDLYEARAALLAAREKTELPVLVTMSMEEGGRTFTGCTPEAMAGTLEGLGAAAVGLNCSLGPAEMRSMIRRLRACTTLPLIAKPNAGLPDPATGKYTVNPTDFAEMIRELIRDGASFVGGCCGTSPAFIREIAKVLEGQEMPEGTKAPVSVPGMVCTPTVCKRTDRVLVIGERINPTGKKRLQQALKEGDLDYIVDLAVGQMDAGADILDVNVGYPGVNEEKLLPKVVKAIQAVVDLPLQIDTTNPQALEAALRVYNGKAAVNSVNGKEESLRTVLPIVRKYGAAVVGLTLDERGIPESAEERAAIGEKIAARAEGMGIPRENVWLDCLTLTVSAQQAQAAETLRAVRIVTEKLGLKTVLGVSNISFGLPARPLMTRSFLTAALAAGLTMPILNPNQTEMMDAVAAWRVLNGEDEGCGEYVKRFAERTETAPVPSTAASLTLREAIARGMKGEAGKLTGEALKNRPGLEIVEQEMIPALEGVGMAYEQGKAFLPQLLSAAQAAREAFNRIREALAAQGSGAAEDKGRIVMATVQGDIHDIGKNIVIIVLENYGYRVKDLGRDVAPETIVRTVQEENIPLVGLSALMTTTLPAMEKTVRLLKEMKTPPGIMVGGAVVTQEYADEIGADYYAGNVRDAVKIAADFFR